MGIRKLEACVISAGEGARWLLCRTRKKRKRTQDTSAEVQQLESFS